MRENFRFRGKYQKNGLFPDEECDIIEMYFFMIRTNCGTAVNI